jgi:hypothetical protein
MSRGPVRRAQLIAPFGVGAMMILQDGTSVMTAGLDHWFKREPGASGVVNPHEYELQEWRLERMLRVGHFRLPPDHRKPFGWTAPPPNMALTVPVLRFPQWHFCAGCRALSSIGLAERGRIQCRECASEGRRRRFLAQVPFIAMCAQGHARDFPWREWVHRNATPSCTATIRLVATGSASLGAQQVKCDCGEERSLLGITQADPDGTTVLTQELDPAEPFTCDGQRLWLGADVVEACGLPLRGSLRGAGNVYYADVRSAIFLPRDSDAVPERLLNLLDEPAYSTVLRIMAEETTPTYLRRQSATPLQPYTDADIARAIDVILRGQDEVLIDPPAGAGPGATEEELRRAEFRALREQRSDEELVIRVPERSEYAPDVRAWFSRITLVEKLRETRALAGFSRVFTEDGRTLAQRKDALWLNPPRRRASWLPAYVVFGEGLFLEFDEAMLARWERRPGVQARAAVLADRFDDIREERHLRDRAITPRLVLLHTFAHLVITRLTFDCGYSSASLRERLFVSSNPASPMAGVLIYTAAGDAEGTMGGLVRMGKPGNLEPVVRRAIAGAQWCSADPVCAETKAQGPMSINMAACHSCALVPETACEEFNRFLDRMLVVPLTAATAAERELAFFPAATERAT